MSSYRLAVQVKPRAGLLDPEGSAVQHALDSLGFHAVTDVRVGKAIYLDVEAESADEALTLGDAMCRKLLANPVTEDYTVGLESVTAEAP